MANWYCDPSKPGAGDYTSPPVAGGTVPTKCEDGNGKASGTATMATLVITFTGIPNNNETITIGGVTFTAKSSGATGDQFNAVTDATTCATNLKNAINASTTNLVNPTKAIATAPLRNVVNATSSAGVVTVYTRTGGTEWNSVTETENLTNASITAQWSGGGDGAWGYAMNTAAIGYPTSVAVGTHGGLCNGSYLGAPAAGDTIKVRTGRNNTNIELDLGTTAFSATWSRGGAISSYVTVEFDDGTVWNDGQSNKVFVVKKSGAGNNATITLSGFTHWKGKTLTGASVQDGGTPNFKFDVTGASSPYNLTVKIKTNTSSTTPSNHNILDTVEVADTYGSGFCNLDLGGNNHVVNYPARLVNCKLAHMTVATRPIVAGDSVYGGAIRMEGCLYVFGNITSTQAFLNNAGSQGHYLHFIRPKFQGGNGGHHAIVSGWPGAPCNFVIEDPVDMGQFLPSDSSASICGAAGFYSGFNKDAHPELGRGTVLTSNRGDRMFIIDTPRKLLEWRSASFPTTGLSTLPDGTAYSVRFSPSPIANVVNQWQPERGVRQVVVNSFADGDRTLTFHCLIDSSWGGSAYTPAANEWWIEGTYVNTNGVTVPFSTKGTALAADSQSWSAVTFAPFAGASRNYSKWKATATLTGVETLTEVVCYLVCAKGPSTMNEWVFIDPSPVLS